ncbi:MAG TPA: CoA-binding protein [Candidatus Avacidaminococcus intestinavium]|uniref:CoA-binding protein n=1 Tax=Candidatus Avacidaminococcus intestinavium TaxID=2840684 RepID=A0A9D1MQ81_9FIRM|nr:CoA-binding protein [Candidatus Avacidaminococcus intestinavium]
MSVEEALKKKVWAVVGANANKEKFGCKIYNRLKKEGYEVYPVNPGLEEIDGAKCYASLADLPVKPDVVDIVVPAKIGVETVKEAAEQSIKVVWLQPGADKQEVVKAAEEVGLEVIKDCVLVRLNNK